VQNPTADPRADLTTADVVGLIQDAPGLILGGGAELLSQDLTVLEDITADLLGGSVSRSSYANLHGSAALTLSRELNWGRAIVRPYMTLSDGVTTARFNLGAYFTAVPQTEFGGDPVLHAVGCFDLLHALSSPVGEAYSVPAGATILAEVANILEQQGFTRYAIDQARGDATMPSARVWPIEDDAKWLTIVNDLLSYVGYAGIWSDWDGVLRCQPYLNPRDRSPEWYYDTSSSTSMLDVKRVRKRDMFDAPNRWVAVRQSNTDGPAPVEGNGVYTYVNEREGDTSVEARGRVITAPVLRVDAVDHDALVAAAWRTIDADMRRETTLEVATAVNPLHWHFDRAFLNDPELGGFMDVLCTQWTLQLPPSTENMTHVWAVLG
jgi:hypothetical protein